MRNWKLKRWTKRKKAELIKRRVQGSDQNIYYKYAWRLWANPSCSAHPAEVDANRRAIRI